MYHIVSQIHYSVKVIGGSQSVGIALAIILGLVIPIFYPVIIIYAWCYGQNHQHGQLGSLGVGLAPLL